MFLVLLIAAGALAASAVVLNIFGTRRNRSLRRLEAL
jgi:hypothetical protein